MFRAHFPGENQAKNKHSLIRQAKYIGFPFLRKKCVLENLVLAGRAGSMTRELEAFRIRGQKREMLQRHFSNDRTAPNCTGKKYRPDCECESAERNKNVSNAGADLETENIYGS